MPRSASPAVLVHALMALAWAAPHAAAQAQDGQTHKDLVAVTPGEEVMLQAGALLDDAEIGMDGRLTEDAWARVIPITDFTQQEPVEGGTPSRPTEVRVVYDEDNLYIGAMIYDDPEAVLAFQRQRDAGLGTDDRFMWILDTFMDGRTGYFFEINAAGLMGDGIITGGGGGGFGGPGGGGGGGGGTNKAWDGIWEARTAMLPNGWSAEIRIPFRTLNFDPQLDTWGINFQRTIRRYNEEILWRGYQRGEGLFSPVFAGRITGLSGLSQGLGLEARPSLVAGWRNQATDLDSQPVVLGPTAYPRDVSLDINYSLTSSLRASLSLNTDFAEVESDQRQVNLTRFPTRFPEQRDFFLEGSGVFNFAPRSGTDPFFSRRIGLNEGQQVPIQYGGRLTGQIGRYEVGFYQIGTGHESFFDGEVPFEIPREDFTAARIKRGLFEQSTIGAIYTRRATGAGAGAAPVEDAHTAGVDVELATRHFLGENNAELQLFMVWNSNVEPGVERSFGDLTARGFRITLPNPVWSGHLSYRELGEAYEPALGFVTRNNFRRIEPRIGYSPRPDISWIRSLDFSAQFRNLSHLETGIVEERQWQFNVLGVQLESGDNFNFQATRNYEFLDEGYEIVDGVDILGGAYTNWEYNIFGWTAGRRRVSLRGGFNWGGFWNGDRIGFNTRVTFRPMPGVSVSGNFDHNDVSLPQGDFTANVYELEGEWNPSPWVSSTVQVQYDNQSELVGFFGRMRWIVTPGSDVFVVYTQNWLNQPTGLLDHRELVTISRGGAVKFGYTYRF